MFNASLNQALLSEIFARISRGELQYCKQLGFDESELSAITQLNSAEIWNLCNSSVSFATVKINHEVFWKLFEQERENSQQSAMIDRALELGASSEMLHERFGWSSADVSARRRLRGIKEPMGRKRNASEDEELAVWELWKTNKDKFDDESTLFDDKGFDTLMLISEETGVSLTEVQRLVTNWIRRGR